MHHHSRSPSFACPERSRLASEHVDHQAIEDLARTAERLARESQQERLSIRERSRILLFAREQHRARQGRPFDESRQDQRWYMGKSTRDIPAAGSPVPGRVPGKPLTCADLTEEEFESIFGPGPKQDDLTQAEYAELGILMGLQPPPPQEEDSSQKR